MTRFDFSQHVFTIDLKGGVRTVKLKDSLVHRDGSVYLDTLHDLHRPLNTWGASETGAPFPVIIEKSGDASRSDTLLYFRWSPDWRLELPAAATRLRLNHPLLPWTAGGRVLEPRAGGRRLPEPELFHIAPSRQFAARLANIVLSGVAFLGCLLWVKSTHEIEPIVTSLSILGAILVNAAGDLRPEINIRRGLKRGRAALAERTEPPAISNKAEQ